MNGKLIYGLLLLVLMLNATWQWMHFETPVLKHAVMPPSLPKMVKYKEQLAALLAHNLWDKSRGASKQKINASLATKQGSALTWTLKGVGYDSKRSSVAVIASGDGVKWYHEGDMLPDTSLLIQVIARGILIEKGGKKQYVYLFKKK